jgi:DNA primase
VSFRRGAEASRAAAGQPRGERLVWEEVKESLRFEDVLDELAVDVVEVRKGEHWAHCPLPGHTDSSPSFSINDDTMYWHCFVCDEGGGLPDLVGILRGLDDWQEKLRWLAPFSDVAVHGGDEVYRKRVVRIQRNVERWGQRKARRQERMPAFAPGALNRFETAPMAELARWNITSEDIRDEFRLGFDGAHERYGYTGPALIVPHFFRGRLVGYQERWLDDDRPDHVKKWTNTDDFPKGETLYNWDRAVEHSGMGHEVVVVEAAMTVVRLACIGIVAVATFGSSVKEKQLRLLGSLPGGLALAFEDDDAGRKATAKLAEELRKRTPVRVAPSPGGKQDYADVPDEGVFELLSAALPYDPLRPNNR